MYMYFTMHVDGHVHVYKMTFSTAHVAHVHVPVHYVAASGVDGVEVKHDEDSVSSFSAVPTLYEQSPVSTLPDDATATATASADEAATVVIQHQPVTPAATEHIQYNNSSAATLVQPYHNVSNSRSSNTDGLLQPTDNAAVQVQQQQQQQQQSDDDDTAAVVTTFVSNIEHRHLPEENIATEAAVYQAHL